MLEYSTLGFSIVYNRLILHLLRGSSVHGVEEELDMTIGPEDREGDEGKEHHTAPPKRSIFLIDLIFSYQLNHSFISSTNPG